VLAHDADPAEVEARLTAALLTDAEVAAGDEAWRRLPDPFGWWGAARPDPGERATARRADIESEER
jgi:hypothetical protein